MSTATLDTARPAGALGRIWAVVKLNLANPWTAVITPLVILGVIFAANWAIWAILARSLPQDDLADATDGISYSGASTFIFVYMMIVAVQVMNLTFAYALGFGVTRRDFYLGSALTFVILSAGLAALMGVLSLVEEATDGWGLQGSMFTTVWFGDGGALERTWIFFVLFLFFFFTGAVFAAIYVRYKANGLLAAMIGLGALLIAAAALLTFTGSWPRFAEFFVTWGWVGSYTWSLVLTAIAGVAGFFVLQRATPRS
jgi:hypothetical protein